MLSSSPAGEGVLAFLEMLRQPGRRYRGYCLAQSWSDRRAWNRRLVARGYSAVIPACIL